MEDAVDVVVAEELCDELGIADITMGEGVAGIAFDGGEVLQIAGVGEFVEIDEFVDGEGAIGGGITEEVMD